MYQAYKILHFAGIAALMVSLGALTFHALGGGTKENAPARPLVFATHGLALAILLITGFGMMARLVGANAASYAQWWPWGKVAVWLVLGGLVAVPLRMPKAARFLWPLLPVLVAIAAAIVLTRGPVEQAAVEQVPEAGAAVDSASPAAGEAENKAAGSAR